MMARRFLRRQDRAVAALEFALVMPVVVLIMMAVADYGNALQQSLRLEAAARAGAQVAFTRPGDTRTNVNDPSIALVRNAVRSSLPGWAFAPSCLDGAGNGVCVTYQSWCQCPQGNTVSPSVGYNCNDANPPCEEATMRFASVTVTRNYTPLLIVPISTLRGNVEIRTQ